ncbi:MAG: addiction module protein [Acidobacteria bacterium]|nr:addiction module protein [Acidobacteriota bacterium]
MKGNSLTAELLASLDGPADPDAEQAWDAEIDRRIEAIEVGDVALEPWQEFTAAIRWYEARRLDQVSSSRPAPATPLVSDAAELFP